VEAPFRKVDDWPVLSLISYWWAVSIQANARELAVSGGGGGVTDQTQTAEFAANNAIG
jgi:hypothetical protein